jgi:hypothetical protein
MQGDNASINLPNILVRKQENKPVFIDIQEISASRKILENHPPTVYKRKL